MYQQKITDVIGYLLIAAILIPSLATSLQAEDLSPEVIDTSRLASVSTNLLPPSAPQLPGHDAQDLSPEPHQEDLDESPDLSSPEDVTEPLPFKRHYEWVNDQNETMVIDVQKSWDTGHASIYVNQKEVVRFRSGMKALSPIMRARMVAGRLYRFLSNNGKPEDIRPAQQDGQAVITAGEEVLLLADPATAKIAAIPAPSLARVWANQLRSSLGADPLLTLPDSTSVDNTNYESTGVLIKGLASWYGPGFHGRRAANGSRFNMYEMTAAHKSLKFGTILRVINQKTGKTCIVKITDRGPYAGNRVIDLSKAAADKLGMLSAGVAPITAEVLTPIKQTAATSQSQ